MNQYFQSIFSELESQRSALLTNIHGVSDEQFNRQPSPGKWSLAEVLTHIITAEQLSLGYMKKKILAKEELPNSGLSESIRLAVLKVSQRIPALKFKAPAVVLKSTPPAFTKKEVLEHWQRHREELKQFLETIPEKDVRKLVYKHPLAGRFDARQALVFFREHIIHHLPQINRLL